MQPFFLYNKNKKKVNMLKKIYTKILFSYPKTILILLTMLIFGLSLNLKNLEIDASSESLLLKNDKSLSYTREINEKYSTNDFLIVTYTPKEDLLSDSSLNTIKNISKDLLKLKDVESINSILNVPLLESPILKLSDLSDGINTVEKLKDSQKLTDDIKSLIKKEFVNSPLYESNLVSKDLQTTAIVINLKTNNELLEIIKKRNNVKTKEEENELNLLIKDKISKSNEENKILIENIRNIIQKHQIDNNMFLGGVSMISNDIITYIKKDVVVYGMGLVLIMFFVLYYLFKSTIWVFITLFISFLSVILSSSIIAILNIGVTVISSNFVSLQLILTTSIIFHLIIRYKELIEKAPNSTNMRIILNTVLSKYSPTLFAVITTIIGFLSLVLSGILPIINLGIMMSISILASLFICFVYFPLFLFLFKKINNRKTEIWTPSPLALNIILNKSKYIYILVVLIIVFSFVGISKLVVENSFINYFKQNTEIYKSMYLIDKKLGGTTPLDVIVDLSTNTTTVVQESKLNDEVMSDEFDDEFNDEFNDETSGEDYYWFTSDKMEKINKIHNYLTSLEEIGYVQSFSTVLQVGKKLNDGEDLKSLELGILYKKLPEEYKNILIKPYVDIPNNQLRFTMRVIDSNDNLRRNELLTKIKNDVSQIVGDNDEVHLSNLMLLYNNMLQSLFDSQIKTLGFVLLFIFIMFIILFKNIKLSIIAIISNIIPIGLIFAFMGIFNIPLDIMTITIASISIGIGVDDAIHYIHRYKEEFEKNKCYVESMKKTHKAVGSAMYSTTLIIMIGFSILILSNLIPTIYFGLLTAVTMFVSLVSSLILLPKLILLLKPFSGNKN